MYLNENDKSRSLENGSIKDDEMALSEHIEEFSQRIIFCLILLLMAIVICFADIKQIVQIFQMKYPLLLMLKIHMTIPLV